MNVVKITIELPERYFEILRKFAEEKAIRVEDLAKLFLIDKIEEEELIDDIKRGRKDD